MRLSVVAAALVLATVADASLDRDLDTPLLRPLARALAASVAKSLPIPAASSGITFTFDPKTSAFERETEVLGQVFLERARPIGRGKLNLSLTYQYVAIDTFDGHDLGSLRDLHPIRDPTPPHASFVIPRLDLSLVTHQVTASVTYGLTDDVELNLTVPLVQTELDVTGRARLLGGGAFGPQHGATRDSAFGVGDVFLRGKYRLLVGPLGELAAGLVFRLPAGKEGSFQGTGLFEVGPRLYASTPAIQLVSLVRLQGFVNAGLDLTPERSGRSEGRYGAGIDCFLASRATLSVAFLAREPFSRLVSPGAMDVRRADGTRSAAFGLDAGHPSYYDLSVGGRVNLWRDTLFLMLNVVVPVNRDGVRASVVPLVGLEATF